MDEITKKVKSSKESLAYLDDLTGIYNRRYLKTTQKECEELQDTNIPYAVVIVDLDHFKEINDTYGHIKGDEIIKEFAQFLKNTLRTTDIVVRYGGDEFVCMMSNTDQKDARQIYTRILDRCKKRKFAELDIMVSAGIASYPADGEGFEQLLKIADESLYDAKRSGRGRIGSIRKKRVELPTSVYIGRREERETLKNFLTESNEHARVAIIEGNVGIGKTRLVKETLSSISRREILWSDCLAFFEGIPYYPIREIIKYKIRRQGKKIIDDIPLAYRIEIGKLIPEVMEEVKGQVDELGLVLDKYRLYESIRMMIELGGRTKIIVIDNMQWADRESTESIKYLLRVLRDHPVTFLFIYRQEEKTDTLEEFTSSISRETEVKKMELGPLEKGGIKELIKVIIGEEPGRDLFAYIEQGSGGNPFYIEEIVKALSDAGYLRVENEQWQFAGPGVEIIPKSIEDITERKYQGLSKEGQEILEIASVIGDFNIEIIKAITDYNEGHIIGVIENIKRLGLLKDQGDRVEFQDELSRNTIYQRNVTGAKARMLHKKVGEKIEEIYKDRRNEVSEQLALHYYRAMDKDKGVRYCLEAGDRAKEKYANSSALRYYAWAEELLRNEKDVEKKRSHIECLLRRADLLGFIGDNENAMKNLEDGLADAQQIADKKMEVESRFRKVSVYVNTAQFLKAIDEANECIKIYETLNDKRGVAKVLNAIGNTQGFLGAYDQALNSYEQALTLARNLNDKNFEARILNNIGLTCMNLGNHNRALQYFEDSLKTRGEIGDKYLEGAVLNNIGLVYMNAGWYTKALKNYQEALKIFREIGNKYGEALALNNNGIIYSNLGDYSQGIDHSENSLKIARDTENRYCETLALNNIGNIHGYRGDYERAQHYLKNSLEIAEARKSSEQVFKNLVSLGYLYLTMNDFKKAKPIIDKVYNKAQELNLKRSLTDALSLSCDCSLAQENIKQFETTMKMLEGLSKEARSKKFEGEYNLLYGRYYTALEEFGKAATYLRQAFKVFDEIGERLNIGIVYYYEGIMELQGGKKSVAQERFKKSLEIFTALNAKGWQAKIDKALKEI